MAHDGRSRGIGEPADVTRRQSHDEDQFSLVSGRQGGLHGLERSRLDGEPPAEPGETAGRTGYWVRADVIHSDGVHRTELGSLVDENAYVSEHDIRGPRLPC